MLKATDERGARVSTGGAAMFPLSVDGLRFEDRGRVLLDGVTLALDGVRRTVVIGPNGAGKSLLLRVLHGLIRPTAGRVTWAGQPAAPELHARQALVFQRPTLLRRSALDNLVFVLEHLPRTERKDRARELLASAKLAHVGETPARLLSGGEQQRLSIARALARSPDVLFLDEPSASLDPASTALIEEMILASHADGAKIILVTHDMGQARRIADDIVFMAAGRVAETADSATFFARPTSAEAKAYLAGHLVL